MKEIGSMIKLMVKVSMNIKMGRNTMGVGMRTCSMAMEKKFGQIRPVIKVNIFTERKMELENLAGVMGQVITVSLKIISLMGKELIYGVIKENMKESG